MRAAVFYAPEAEDPLADAGAAWLGWDAVARRDVPQPSPKLACLTATPARYGFHATLKPPMYVATSLAALAADLEVLAAGLAPFALPPLEVGRIGDALGLVARKEPAALQALCDACVSRLDRHRVSPSDREIARRRQVGLSPLEERMLARWGYPYVFAAWRFHMTLTSAVPAKIIEERSAWAVGHFAPSLAMERMVRSLALFVEPADGARFYLEARFSLGGTGRASGAG